MVRKICQRSLFVLSFILVSYNLCFAQGHSASQMERTSEDLEKEKVLRNRLEEEKVFIEKVIVQGATLLDREEIRKIVRPFLKRWLYKSEIENIIRLLNAAYKKKGYPGQPVHIFFQVIDKCLKIRVEEN